MPLIRRSAAALLAAMLLLNGACLARDSGTVQDQPQNSATAITPASGADSARADTAKLMRVRMAELEFAAERQILQQESLERTIMITLGVVVTVAVVVSFLLARAFSGLSSLNEGTEPTPAPPVGH